jgi:hypothetical protein
LRTSIRFALIAVALAVVPPHRVESQAASQRIVGVLVDSARTRPLVGATLSWQQGSDTRNVRTDDNGRFVISAPRTVSLDLDVRALGYEPRVFRIQTAAFTRDTLRLVLAPLTALSAVRVTAARSYAGFEDRRARGRGQFVDSAALAKREPMFVGDAVRNLGRVDVRANRGFGQTIRLRTPRGTCEPTIFIDGVDRDIRSADLDAFVAANDIRGIEVYVNEADVPQGFVVRPFSGCGAIMIWKREKR